MLPLVAALVQWGLPILAGVVQTKGAEIIKEKTGVDITAALGTEEGRLKLKQAEFEHEEFLSKLIAEADARELDYFKIEAAAITDRWKADMGSDSWLSKNVRPLIMLYLLGMVTVFGICSALKFIVDPIYVELTKIWGSIAFTAYFGGRTYEKAQSMKKGKQ